ncbi:MAG: hypothetical protein O9340_12890 [Cyclobacteriaceae bacterium]|nr:hypothetical protein [Cyclobacteriaceae bacterium]
MKENNLEGKILLKVMWTSEEETVVWDMKSEENLKYDSKLVSEFCNYFDLVDWSKKFKTLYSQWLEEDADFVYKLDNPLISSLLLAIKKFNFDNNEVLFFYWYDVDRTKKNNFSWSLSPITGKPLIDLGSDFHPNNRLISLDDFIVFPTF